MVHSFRFPSPILQLWPGSNSDEILVLRQAEGLPTCVRRGWISRLNCVGVTTGSWHELSHYCTAMGSTAVAHKGQVVIAAPQAHGVLGGLTHHWISLGPSVTIPLHEDIEQPICILPLGIRVRPVH